MGAFRSPHFLLAPPLKTLSNLPFTMKKILIPILIALVSALPMRAQNILVIDVSNVFNNLFELKNEMNKLTTKRDTYSGYLNQQGQVLQQMLVKAQELETQAKNPALTTESRQAFESQWADQQQLIDKRKLDIQQFYQNSSDDINKGQQQIVQMELDKLKAVVKDIAVQKKATLVLNTSPLGIVSSVVYNSDDKALDITEAVLAKLNKDYTDAGGVQPASTTPAMPTLTPAATTPATGTAKPAASGK